MEPVPQDERWELIAQAYDAQAERLARRILALTGDRASVDDLVNETFVRAYESLGRFEGQSQLSTWLHGIAVNVARAHLAKRRRRRRLDDAFEVEPRSSPSAETQLQEQRAVQSVYAAVTELPDELREAFVLCVLERRSLKEASQVLGVPVSTLHARRQRAEARVRERIDRGHR